VQLFDGSKSEKVERLVMVALVLGLLLIVLALWILLGNVFGLLGRVNQPIALFTVGALLAYIMYPLVGRLEVVVKKRWLAVAASYLLVFAALLTFGVVLLTPLVGQTRTLIKDLRNPEAASLEPLRSASLYTRTISSYLQRQDTLVASGQSIPTGLQTGTETQIRRLQHELALMATNGNLVLGIRLPPSYLSRIETPADRLVGDYRRSLHAAGATRKRALLWATADARAAEAAARVSYMQATATPILVLNAQTWLDKRGIRIELRDKFGSILTKISKQLSSILNQALGIALQAGTLFIDTVLTLIISIYFILDGKRFINWCIGLVPQRGRPRAQFFVRSLDQVLGTQIRTGIVMAGIAAALQMLGALIFGVPFAGLIFLSTFLLSLVPVVGPIILPLPPLVIALVFMPLPTAIEYFVWVMVVEQILRNFVGPRVIGKSFGIHPLEAMAAAMVGYPVAGFMGAFLAVPAVAFLHIVVTELKQSKQHAFARPKDSTSTDVPASNSADAVPAEASGSS